MKAEVKAEWLKRLRSGKYTQTAGALHRVLGDDPGEHQFCCLGVLCEIAVEQEVVKVFDERPENDDRELEYGRTLMGAYTGVPPEEVLVWAEVPKRTLEDRHSTKINNDEFHFKVVPDSPLHEKLKAVVGLAEYRGENPEYSLVEMNDSGEFTFAEIADVIEQYF